MSQTLTLTRIETKLFVRDWPGLFFVFVLPLGLLTIFSLIGGADDGSDGIPPSFLPTMAIGIGIGLLGMATLPMILAGYREKGVLRRMSTTPVRPVKLLIAQLLLHLVAAALVIALILAAGALLFDADLPGSVLPFGLAALLFSIAQLSIGLLIAGLVSTAKAASIVGNILFFTSMFFAGVWTPGDLMPESIRWLRDVTPLGAGMTSLQDAWAGHWPGFEHVVALVAVTVVCVAVAARYFRWE
ncbi:ABC-2 type transporter [Kribbella flavida DSM 17836]|uniref:Transport permease protein n=1 Tax=Kribbella flavida (strain DSM 17836 / JCM 10339 / NBRC 14399) TaxID=479435 RepID=D2PRE6_KRIFD|nr:ABC transporter permease [Kribbella flavida]ADB34864.1 ABC-2 type transporter [Kribbella flavida DSM 17836]